MYSWLGVIKYNDLFFASHIHFYTFISKYLIALGSTVAQWDALSPYLEGGPWNESLQSFLQVLPTIQKTCSIGEPEVLKNVRNINIGYFNFKNLSVI